MTSEWRKWPDDCLPENIKKKKGKGITGDITERLASFASAGAAAQRAADKVIHDQIESKIEAITEAGPKVFQLGPEHERQLWLSNDDLKALEHFIIEVAKALELAMREPGATCSRQAYNVNKSAVRLLKRIDEKKKGRNR